MRLFSVSARVFSLAALVAACGRSEQLAAQGNARGRDDGGERPIVQISSDDKAMNAAIDRARATVPKLIERLKQTPPRLSYLGVKVRLGGPGDAGEHIWLYDVTYADGKIVGKLAADARMFPSFDAGHVVQVEPREISDWMTVENGRACGGFTSRILVAELTVEQRAGYMKEMGIARLPSGGIVCDDGSSGGSG
ncbi:MAG TPA: DUF2314 domain-containing protein [Longimicrobium sp.]|jgi:uncharacterized protein YegJ (DUF2314 family)